MNIEGIGLAVLDGISMSVRKRSTAIAGLEKYAVPGYIARRICDMSAATRTEVGSRAEEWLTLEGGVFAIEHNKLGSTLSEVEVEEMLSEEIQNCLMEGAPMKMIKEVMGVSLRRVSDEMTIVKLAMPDGPYANGLASINNKLIAHITRVGLTHFNSMTVFKRIAKEFEADLPEIWAAFRYVKNKEQQVSENA